MADIWSIPCQRQWPSPCDDHPHDCLAQVMWLKNGDLGCDTCNKVYDFPGPRVMIINNARAHGWHMYDGRTLGGSPFSSHICPDCMGTARSKLLAPLPRLEEDQSLF